MDAWGTGERGCGGAGAQGVFGVPGVRLVLGKDRSCHFFFSDYIFILSMLTVAR